METNGGFEILLVEDNPQDADLTLRAFSRRKIASRVKWLEDGEAALDYLFRRGSYGGIAAFEQPKVVLLDLKLPKVDGLEVLDSIRRDRRTLSIPVVIVSSSRQDPDIERAYALGANSYVVKPIDFESFTECMASVGGYWLLVNQPPA